MDALLPNLVFYVLAVIVLVSAAFTAFSANLVHAAFSLLFTFFGVAALYLYMSADFVGISQVIIYVGGILILLLFGVMFTSSLAGGTVRQTLQTKRSLFLLLLMFCMMIPVVFVTPWPSLEDGQTNAMIESSEAATGTVADIGRLLLTKYLLPFEIASLLLLVALIGAVVIARGQPAAEPETEEESGPAETAQAQE